MTEKVKIVEVGPRDGLQNEKQSLSLETKLQFIEGLFQAGLRTIEVGSFVRADKIPQMANSAELFKAIPQNIKDSSVLPCLVPNTKGFEMAVESGVKEVAIFTATSESFNKKNINASIEESLDRLRPVAVDANKAGVKIRGYISTAFGCPYEGKTSAETFKMVANRLLDFGVYEISVGDTIGVARPNEVTEFINEMEKHFDHNQLAMHFHDTWGMAIANAEAAYSCGIRTFDSSAGGLGGCPYAKGATGNVATEDLIYLFEGKGIKTGVDLDKLVSASSNVLKELSKKSASRVHNALIAKGN